MLTKIRFWKSTPRILRGWKSIGIGCPFGWGSTAVPEGGFWWGVKNDTPGAGSLYWRDMGILLNERWPTPFYKPGSMALQSSLSRQRKYIRWCNHSWIFSYKAVVNISSNSDVIVMNIQEWQQPVGKSGHSCIFLHRFVTRCLNAIRGSVQNTLPSST